MAIENSGELDGIIYTLFSAPSLDREEAASLVRAMARGEYFTRGMAAYSRAIEQALRQPDPVTAALEPPYSEAQVREFLALVYDELQKAKPWPGTDD
ncbi:hypothetical protein [Amycolatopsis sacchari]|uniref:Uncharacterized protein n=2 Tax=Amycolatopsis dongchuanensis TaxID=1070866 RepID=A0ABP8VPN3_9PSEU